MADYRLYRGLSVLIKNEKEFDRMKEFLGNEVLYLEWVPQMQETETAIIIHHDMARLFSIGSVGSAKYHRERNIRVVEFEDYFKL